MSLIKIDTTTKLKNNFRGDVAVGTVVETSGYYTVGDGGGATWDVVLASSVTIDGYGVIAVTGSATLALVLRTGDVVNVKQFGAVGDGVTNSAPHIQSALDNAKTVVIPDGIFAIASSVILNSNNTLIGSGIDNSTVKNISGAPLQMITSGLRIANVYSAGKKENITVEGITVDGNVVGTKIDDNPGVSFSYCDNIAVKSVKVINSNGGAVRVDGYSEVFEDAAYLAPTDIAANGLSSVSGSSTVTVSAPRHGLNGGLVTVANVSAFNGLSKADCEGEFSVTIVDGNSFSYTSTGTATSTGVGGGTSIDIFNARHSTRWGQSINFVIENCQMDNVYLGIEVEGGALNGRIIKNKVTNTKLHGIRIPSGYNIRVADNETTDIGSTAHWADRSSSIIYSGNHGSNISKNAFGLGILSASSIKDNSIQISDPSVWQFLSDNFQRSVGIVNCIIKDNSSNGKIKLTAGSDTVTVKDNACIIDAVRPLNKDIVVADNFGYLEQATSLDQYSTRFGGDVEVVRAKGPDGSVSKYSTVDGVSISAFVIFNGNGGATIQNSFGVTSVVRNGVGDYTVTFDREYTTSLNGVCSAIFPAVSAVPTSAVLGPPAIMGIAVRDAAGTQLDSTLVTLFVIGY